MVEIEGNMDRIETLETLNEDLSSRIKELESHHNQTEGGWNWYFYYILPNLFPHSPEFDDA